MSAAKEIHILKQICEDIRSLLNINGQWLELFVKETQCIREHNLQKLESQAQIKSQLSENMLGLYTHIRDGLTLLHDMKMPHQEKDQSSEIPLEQLSQFKVSLQHIYEQGMPHDYTIQTHIVKVFDLIDKLIVSNKDLKPKIYENREIMENILSFHLQSYRFWSELSKENSQSYTDKGVRKNQQSISQLSVKA